MFKILLLLYLINNSFGENNVGGSLLMVQAIFRHGERTPEHFYPNDPNINNTLYPIGFGGLTNRGKLQEYKLGQYLRKRYGSFLGDIYSPDVMEIRSTDYDRTKMSALLVAAGLWPPAESQIWNDDLKWLPIPIDYKSLKDEDLINPKYCDLRNQILKEQSKLADVQEKFIKPYKDLMKYVEENSGKSIDSLKELVDIYLTLRTEMDTNLTIPAWTKPIYPEPLIKIAPLAYKYFNYDPRVRIINNGYFLAKILNDFKMKQDKTGQNKMKKIYLYGAHESNVGQLLDILDAHLHVPPYASVLMFELHYLQDKYKIKILYNRDENRDNGTVVEDLMPAGCTSPCEIHDFELLFEGLLPKISYKEACKLPSKLPA